MDATIRSSFWADPRLEGLSPQHKLALLWLVTNPARDLCGFTRISPRRFEFETGLPFAVLDEVCQALPGSFAALGDGLYFASRYLRHQFGKGGKISARNNVLAAARKQAETLPEPMRARFFEAYPELAPEGDGESAAGAVSTGAASIPTSPPPPLPEISQGVIARARAGEGAGAEAEPKKKEAPRTLSPAPPAPDPVAIVGLYPRRENIQEAVEQVRRAIRFGDDPREMVEGTRAAAAVIARLPSGHLNAYVPSAAAFFRNKRWQDDPQTWLRHGTAPNGGKAEPLSLGGRRGTVVRI